ncbi:GMC oxidoreductase [Pararoseomonas indoligenes]|uniref:GMC family oxidoreductase n=1 Tax=Roseomonas indoligenes TaxID=2820811 RepID=A0A940S3V0_9PROT|nr:GMC family oxidoreductase [Pararoseomonas indoligenes]MBP0492626.1 GMC family oxidoreductase [Pararoseomonas indoligenes]
MILDIESLEDGATLEADLCILGGGAAGITLALQFLRGPGRVILVESGRRAPHPESQALYEGEVADPALHPPVHAYRARRFGGSTTLWGGRCVPLDPIDFTTRPWIPHSGWPFGVEELASWYPAANALCEAGEFDYSAAIAVPGGMRPMIAGFAPRDFSEDGIERFSTPTDFAGRYAHRLAASESVRVVLGANCTGLETAPEGGRVAALRLRTLSGRGATIRAARVVVALGGLETPRLLLASRGPGAEAGVGNGQDLVGRYYMSHIAGTSGRLHLAVPRDAVNAGYEVAEDGTYIRRRLHLTQEAQEREGVGNAVIRLHFPRIPDPSHGSGVLSGLYLARHLLPYEYRKRLETPGDRPSVLRHLRNVVADPLSATGFAWTMLRKRRLAARKFPSVIVRPPGNVFSLDFHGEQEPNPESRVTLADATDPLGVPRLRVDWRATAGDIRTAQVSFRLLAEDLALWGRGSLSYDPEEVGADMLRDGAYGGHHIGTARMGATPATGVVDPECRVHGMANLWVAGSAVFPTSGQANPTLTVVALALRLAAHLKREMQPCAVPVG